MADLIPAATLPFSSGLRVTQHFGDNPTYYKQFGLAGHEGLDCTGINVGELEVFSFRIPGVVVRDADSVAEGRNYGIFLTVWYPSVGEAWQYCHLKENYFEVGDSVAPRSLLGLEGATGNVQGRHLHINRFKVDSTGKRQNTDNGYFGGINPLPFLLGLNQPTGDTMDTQAIALLNEILQSAGIGKEKSDLDRLRDLQQKIKDHVGSDWNGGYLAGDRKEKTDLQARVIALTNQVNQLLGQVSTPTNELPKTWNGKTVTGVIIAP